MRAGTNQEKEEVTMGRRGCRASNRAGILSGWALTLHETGEEGKGHGSRALGDGRREDEEPGQFPHEPEAGERQRGRHSEQAWREDVKKIMSHFKSKYSFILYYVSSQRTNTVILIITDYFKRFC